MKNKIKELLPVLKYFKKYKTRLLIFSGILFITNLSYALLGHLIGEATTYITNKDIKLGLLYLIIYLIIELVADIAGDIAKNRINHIQSDVARSVGFDVYSKMLEMPSYAFEEMNSGQMVNRITRDTDKLVGQVQVVIRIISQVIASILILVYIIRKSLIVAGVIVVFLVSYYFVVKHYTKKLNELNKIRKKENDNFTNIATETVDPSTVNGVTNTSTQPTTQIPSTASTAEQTAMQNNFLQNLLNMFNGLGANNKNNTNVGGAQTATSYTQNNGASAYNGTTANIPTTSATTSKYTDVRQADMEAVNYVSDRGLMVGTSATTFNPDAGVTRAQMVQILYSMSGSPSNVGGKTSYKDVGSGEWYTNAVAWAQNTGLVGGYDDGTFRPNQVLTTEQAAAIFKKYAEQSGKNTYTIKQINNPVNYNSLGGTSDVSNYAQDAVKWAVRDGMIDTSSGSINPKKELTRAEFARYLMNYDINYNGGAGKSNYNVTAKQNPGITQTTTPTATPTKSINEIAAEVINGDWGNGDERRQRLEAAGYNYNEVQSAVNSQFTYTPSSSGGSSPSKTTSSNKYNSTDVWTRTNPNATYGPTTKTKASSNGGHYAEGTTRDNKTTKTTTSSTKSKVDTSFSTVSNVALNSATMVKKVKNTSQTISKPKADAHYISGQSAKKQKFKK